jgi:hypothetical protein
MKTGLKILRIGVNHLPEYMVLKARRQRKIPSQLHAKISRTYELTRFMIRALSLSLSVSVHFLLKS